MRFGTALLLLVPFLIVASFFYTRDSIHARQPRALSLSGQDIARRQRQAAAAAELRAAAAAEPPRPAAASHPEPLRKVGAGLQMDFGSLGVVRVNLRPEWSPTSFEYATGVAAARSNTSTVYRLEPGFLIQGSLLARGVKPNSKNPRGAKVMERGEIGWAGGSKGPDYFIYMGTGPAGWLGVPHDGTVWAEVADEASMLVVEKVSKLEVPPTPPGQMHILATRRLIGVAPWDPYPGWPPRERLLKVVGASIDRAVEACGPQCHALPRTELHGSVVSGGWGSDHKQPSAAACCAACEEQRARARVEGRSGCNVWVWCGSAQCGKQRHECWLKRADGLWAVVPAADGNGVKSKVDILVGTSDRWTAGSETAAPPDHPSGAGLALPVGAEAHFALVFANPALGRVRVRLRTAGAPRASGRLRAMLDAGAAACGGGRCALSRVAAEPEGWGDESRPDGLADGERWPAGAARIEGTFGTAFGAEAPGVAAVEPGPVQVGRGAVAWAGGGAATGDGPEFFIALAAMPHLGVGHTVWGHVVDEDLRRIGAFAKSHAGTGGALTFTLERLSAPLL